MVLPQAAVVVSHCTASSSGSLTFNEFNGPFQPELSERRVPFRHVTIMDLHSYTFKIQLMSCHTFVLITRFRICVMSRPEEQLQRLVKDVARRGLEWAQTSVSELGQADLRGICRAAGLAVLSSRKWLTVSQLREALLSYLASELTKVGSCLTASCKDYICNWNECLYVFCTMFRILKRRLFAFTMTYRITCPWLPTIMFACRHALEAAARQPGAELQRLREEVASRGPEWLGTAVADMCKDELRELCVAAGLRVKSTDGKLWLKMPELREALLAYLSSDAEKAGICLMASCVVNMGNWNEPFDVFCLMAPWLKGAQST